MTDTPTANNRLRKQSVGSNTNTWGDTKLNEVLDAIDQAMDGYLAIALTSSADYTLNTTNYTIADEAKNRVLKFTGTLSAIVNVIVPAVEHDYAVVNACGQTLTIKTSAGTGVSIPNGYQARVFCDGVNVNNGAPTVLPGDVQVAGQVHGVVAATAGTDAVNLTQMSAAIAVAALPGTGGTVRNSVSDTTAGYLSGKVVFTGLKASTVNAGGNESLAVGLVVSGTDTTPNYLGQKITLNGAAITPTNSGANESLNIVVDEGQLALVSGVYGL